MTTCVTCQGSGEVPTNPGMAWSGHVQWLTFQECPDCVDEECGRELVLGRVDPYATSCDLEPGHDGKHEGPCPFGEPGHRIRWVGGGTCAGDPLPHRDIEYIDPSTERR